jgi:4-amino-4-deoxy-L-arabinose transferase-like glycosyltransferase
MALAGALRFIGLGEIPPGLYHDEAFNGLDALCVLERRFPIYFTANQGREPLFIYLIAATIGTLGRTPGAVRLAAAICGTLTIPVTYLMIRAWFEERTALLSAFIISTLVWHVHLSRIGFRAVMLPLALACFLWWAAKALRSNRKRPWLLAGITYGVAFYTYVAVRFTPVALLGFAIYLLLTDRRDRLWPGALYFGIGALITLMPLGVYTALQWDTVMGRPTQVSAFSPVVNQGNLWRTLGQHLYRTLGMFFVRGDVIPRHNIPGRPVFTPLLGAAMVLGAVRAAIAARRGDAGSALTLIWVGAMLVPTIAAADAPHFLRAVGVLPSLVVLPALGLETIWDAFSRWNLRIWGTLLVCLLLAANLGATVRDYFFDYASRSETDHAFEYAATELAARINQFTGVGWDGQGLCASNRALDEERRVYVDWRLWQSWEALPFLVPDQQSLTRFRPNNLPSIQPSGQVLLLLWPYGDLEPYLEGLPQPARIEADVGPLTRGDLEARSYPAYASYEVQPLMEDPPSPLAYFGESIQLTDFSVEREGPIWQVRLEWGTRARPKDDYTAFVYVCDKDCTTGQPLAQEDAQPGGRFYPTHLWRPGDLVVDVRTLELPQDEAGDQKIAVGLYAWPEMERLPVTMTSENALDDMLILTVGN